VEANGSIGLKGDNTHQPKDQVPAPVRKDVIQEGGVNRVLQDSEGGKQNTEGEDPRRRRSLELFKALVIDLPSQHNKDVDDKHAMGYDENGTVSQKRGHLAIHDPVSNICCEGRRREEKNEKKEEKKNNKKKHSQGVTVTVTFGFAAMISENLVAPVAFKMVRGSPSFS